VLCGKYLPVDMTQISFRTKTNGFECACMEHEFSKELEKYVEEHGGFDFDEHDAAWYRTRMIQSIIDDGDIEKTKQWFAANLKHARENNSDSLDEIEAMYDEFCKQLSQREAQ
jgi:hypothetical protein